MKSGVQFQTSSKTGARAKNVIKITLKTVAIRESQTLSLLCFPWNYSAGLRHLIVIEFYICR